MLELFIVGTFWFWALVAVELVLLFVFIFNENGVGATISLVIAACLLQFCGNVNILGFVFDNPGKLMMIVGAYLLLGVVWGTIKWWIYCGDQKEAFQELKASFLEEKGVEGKQVPPELKREWKRLLEQNRRHCGQRGWTLKPTEDESIVIEAPRVWRNKAFVLRSMSWWPISLLCSLLADFVVRVFKAIYNKIAGFLQHIADNMFKGLE